MGVDSATCGYCFLDLDINNHRSKLAVGAAFVAATDSRYRFSSKDLLKVGGSEIARIPELVSSDHEWATKNTACGGITTRPPPYGSRIVVRLFWDVAPLACENFAALCDNGSLRRKTSKVKAAPLGESGKPLTFRKSMIHRVVPGFVVQGGDFVFGNGSGGESVFGKKFKDERAGLQLKHDRRGLLSMGNSGKNSNSSQFFFTFDATPQCDGKHVIFGEIVSGFQVLRAVEEVGTKGGIPRFPVEITDCGIFQPLETPACGYWYDTPDPDSFTGISSVFVVRPRIIVLVSAAAVYEKFASAVGDHVSIVSYVSTDTCTSTISQAEQIMKALSNFVADVAIIAPTCQNVLSGIDVPELWKYNGLAKEDVVFVAKPVEALPKILSQSWLKTKRAQWQLDGYV